MYNPDDLDEQGWEEFQPDATPSAPTERMLAHIEQRVGKAPVRRLRTTWIAAASVAACVLVIAGIVIFHVSRSEKKPAIATVAPIKPIHPAARQTITNSTSATKTFPLPDGSKLRLAAGSSISFDSGFTATLRDILLEGQAVFTVAPDRVRPFTVHTKAIAVTALGTVFGVDDTHNGFTTVLLYSGKVVVKKDNAAGRGFSDVYLAPGQLLTVNRTDLSVRMSTITPQTNAPEKAPAAVPVPQQSMTFTQQPLAEIFTQLHTTYHITIEFNPADLKNMDFTGTFNSEKETLESFLSTICDLNELTLKKTKGNGFSIQGK